jgi:hypothetical protein
MFSQAGGPFDDVNIACYATSGGTNNRTEQIRVKYFSTGRSTLGANQSSGNGIVAIVAHENSVATAACIFDQIEIDVTYDTIVTPSTQKVFTIRKYDVADLPDPTGRGHTFSNIRVSGRVRNWQNGLGAACFDVFSTTSGENWTGDNALNVEVHDVYITGNPAQVGINLNYQPFLANAGVSMQRVYTDTLFGRVNATEQQSLDATQVVSGNLICGGYIQYTPSITGSTSNPTLGNGSAIGHWRREGDWIDGYVELNWGSTSSGGVGNIRFSLPALSAVGENDQLLGGALLLDAGARFYTGVPFIASNVQYVEVFADQGLVTFTAPFTPANGDKYRASFRYLAAST